MHLEITNRFCHTVTKISTLAFVSQQPGITGTVRVFQWFNFLKASSWYFISLPPTSATRIHDCLARDSALHCLAFTPSSLINLYIHILRLPFRIFF